MQKFMPFDLVVFSHLRWEFVWQRPQHILQRFAKTHRVLFVEEPIEHDETENGSARIFSGGKNITVLQPKVSWENFPHNSISLIHTCMNMLKMERPLLWFYSAEFVDVIDSLPHSLVVYDCMDELSAFQNASPLLIFQEKQLMEAADVMFTGGKSLYESKRRFHPNVYCFPSSVDQKHFAKALSKNTKIPADIAALPKPIVGFYGVIDERLDTHLLAEVAQKMPDTSFVLLGPVVKIPSEDLPHFDNIHYLGSKKYEELPHYLKGFDVAMMPFALNKATRFISPTKTLEFMAALKPIVSTAISDVKHVFAKEVSVAHTAAEFIAALDHYFAETQTQKTTRIALQTKVVKQTSWDKTVFHMNDILLEQLQKMEKWSTVTSSTYLSLPIPQSAPESTPTLFSGAI